MFVFIFIFVRVMDCRPLNRPLRLFLIEFQFELQLPLANLSVSCFFLIG